MRYQELFDPLRHAILRRTALEISDSIHHWIESHAHIPYHECLLKYSNSATEGIPVNILHTILLTKLKVVSCIFVSSRDVV